VVRPAPAATRAISLLDYLIAHPTRSFTLSQLARANEMNVASTRTVLAVLTEGGYVVRSATDRTYALGPLLVAAGQATSERYPAIDVARHEMQQLSRAHGVELLLTVVAGDDIVAVARSGRPRPGGLEVGRRVPLVPPLGAVFVAWGAEAELEDWARRAGGGRPGEAAWYRRVLATTRLRGYSVTVQATTPRDDVAEAVAAAADRPGHAARQVLGDVVSRLGHGAYHLDDLSVPGRHRVRMIAAPVFDADLQVMLAISLLDLPEPLDAAQIESWGTRLRDVGIVVTRRTRGEVPPADFS
jgi:DNA-binding IclR family transcriptional regulator